MMFLDCPAYLDQDGAARCGLPAEVRSWFTMDSSKGPLESAMIRCPAGHWFNGPIEFLTWPGRHQQDPGAATVAPSARGNSRTGAHDGCGGSSGPTGVFTGKPGPESSRLNSVPAYYLGRPARLWITAMRPRRRRTPSDHLINAVTDGWQPSDAAPPAHHYGRSAALGRRAR
jgi:hypothetical protein